MKIVFFFIFLTLSNFLYADVNVRELVYALDKISADIEALDKSESCEIKLQKIEKFDYALGIVVRFSENVNVATGLRHMALDQEKKSVPPSLLAEVEKYQYFNRLSFRSSVSDVLKNSVENLASVRKSYLKACSEE